MAEASDAPKKSVLPVRPILILVAVIAVGIALWLFLRPGERKGDEVFTGYVVSDNIYMSSPVAGTLTKVAVQRGQRVAAGDALFRIDPTVRAAETEQARAAIATNEAQVSQQQANLARARSDLAAAQADADRAGAEYRRLAAAQREKPGSVAQLDLDQARASYDGALRKRDAARTQIGSATGAIDAALAQVRQSQAGLTSAERQLDDLAPVAPAAGRVEDVMFRRGESVTPNAPVVSIVPDGQVKVRFYVSQALVSRYQPGRKVVISCDGCPAGMTAIVEFVANEPEYTPPVIYSLDAREKLVFLVEALPKDPRKLLPGQPVDVAPSASDLPAR
ncbi:Secretion protein HlyD precursor [Sphingobium yanoikuyae]|uniref:Secretion protein HlyD n=1 Tax=Sphingobium yanoikuyae TaxID=13690 RepID=A0A084ESW4_SPHYA|nr:HlyD family efflux transporter periplasmic adaptor subunit [Sphingobium yanoikuyae]KEZ21056.1 Secretion protein HlyD precursor [Sphingobium yanoikuyae]